MPKVIVSGSNKVLHEVFLKEIAERRTELAQELRHIAEKLAGGGDVSESVDELWELANELDLESGDDLMAYTEA